MIDYIIMRIHDPEKLRKKLFHYKKEELVDLIEYYIDREIKSSNR